MNFCIVNSKDVWTFGVLSAEFYCNTGKDDRKDVLNFRTDQRVKVEVDKIKPVLMGLSGYPTIVRKTKISMGLSPSSLFGVTASLNYMPRTNLLVLKQVAKELYEYQKNTIEKIKEQKQLLEQEQIILKKLCKRGF